MASPSDYKALLFDLDDTLVDFSESEKKGIQKVYTTYFEKHISSQQFEDLYRSINRHFWDLVEKGHCSAEHVRVERFKVLTKEISSSWDHEELAKLFDHVIGETSNWYPGAEKALASLRKHYRLGVITNGYSGQQNSKYQRLGIDKLCECCIISGTLGVAKPKKEIFHAALDHLKVHPHEVLMVGDSLSSDYQGALNANLDFCWVNNQNHALPQGLPEPKFKVNSVADLRLLLQKS